MSKIRDPIVDGIFYPDSPEALQREFVKFEEKVHDTSQIADAIIVPHAAYDYMGETAAAAYKSLRPGGRKKILLLGPLHREKTDGAILPESEAFRTPLGSIPIDIDSINALTAQSGVIIKDDLPHNEEHCLETQLPFIYRYLPGSRIIPVLMGELSKKTAEAFVEALLSVFPRLHEDVILIATVNAASSGSARQSEKEAGELTKEMKPGNFEYFFNRENKSRLSVCSRECIGILLHHRLGCTGTALLRRSVSPNTEEKTGKKVVYSSYSLSFGG